MARYKGIKRTKYKDNGYTIELVDIDAVQYLNEVSNFLDMGEIVKIKDGKIYDLDSDTEIENLFDYALTLHRDVITYKGWIFQD